MKRNLSLLLLISFIFSAFSLIGCSSQSISEPKDHNLSAWQLEKQATYKKKGQLIRYCLDEGCDYSEKHKIKASAGLTYTEKEGKRYISGIGKFDGEFLYIAAQTKSGDPVDGISINAFSDNKKIKYVYIEEGMEQIEGYAFSGCTELLSAHLPDSVNTVEVGIFMGCDALYSADLPRALTIIPASCFSDCISLRNVNIPKSTVQIAAGAFNLCHSLTEITLPEGLKRIETNAFADCSALSSPTFPESLEVIAFSAFAGCSSFKEIVLPSGLKALYDCSFSACIGLERVFIPSTVTEIYAPWGISPFWHCSSTAVLVTDATERPSGWGEYFAVYDSYADNAPETYQSLKVIYGAEK